MSAANPIDVQVQRDCVPCPFCRAVGRQLEYQVAGHQGFVYCHKCGAHGPASDIASDWRARLVAAVQLWNTR